VLLVIFLVMLFRAPKGFGRFDERDDRLFETA
jgi:hypothetical protein